MIIKTLVNLNSVEGAPVTVILHVNAKRRPSLVGAVKDTLKQHFCLLRLWFTPRWLKQSYFTKKKKKKKKA